MGVITNGRRKLGDFLERRNGSSVGRFVKGLSLASPFLAPIGKAISDEGTELVDFIEDPNLGIVFKLGTMAEYYESEAMRIIALLTKIDGGWEVKGMFVTWAAVVWALTVMSRNNSEYPGRALHYDRGGKVHYDKLNS